MLNSVGPNIFLKIAPARLAKTPNQVCEATRHKNDRRNNDDAEEDAR
jgi:hypothetical protein